MHSSNLSDKMGGKNPQSRPNYVLQMLQQSKIQQCMVLNEV